MSMNSSSKSATADSKSKRSFTSMSNSNPSTSSGNNRNHGNRKKKREMDQNQKTLGMAWGANSRSSSRSAFRNSPFPDFGSYMVMKNQKLHQQFDAEASSSSHSGCSSDAQFKSYNQVLIFELKRHMLKHGGRFENYFSRHCVTHIVCSNLPDSKIKNLRSFSGGLPVLKPSWVVESVAANKLLSWVPYQLDQLASETDNQPKLSTFFGVKSCPLLNDVAECSSKQSMYEIGITSSKSDLIIDANIAEECESREDAEELHLVSDDLVLATGSIDDGPTYFMEDQREVELDADDAMDYGSDARYHPQSSPCPASKSVSNDCVDNRINEESSNSKIIGAASMGRSTLSDANFVENYFKFSRLHFIGTWRNRYRKRFPSSPNGFKDASSSHSASLTSQKTTIIHVDMDCFFVSVVIRNRHDLKDKPVAICHSDNPRGTAEISSANYPARDHGVKAGMFVRDAKALCPQLVIFPYNFDSYEEVADQFYDILHKHCNKVQAVSCDEAFIDVSDSGAEDPQLLATAIRKEILDTTGCTASAGIAGNMLMARVATRIAKPDGCCYIPSEKVGDYLHELPVKALPGIGHVLGEKLKRKQIRTCGQLRVISKESLQKDFGVKTGDMLWNFSRGIDNRLVGVIQESKSVGAEVNWGVRFNDSNDTKDFLLKLCKEVSLRLQGCGVQGRTITLKIKKRRRDAGEPVKYMGCGDCENLSRSITLPMATDDVNVLQRIGSQLFGYFRIDAKDIRGMGLQASKLEVPDTKRGQEKYSIRSWLVSLSARKSFTDKDIGKEVIGLKGLLGSDTVSVVQTEGSLATGDARSIRDATLPALHELDMGVIESLPPEVFSEINDVYAGELIRLISKKKENNVEPSTTLMVRQNIEDVMDEQTSALDQVTPLDDVLHDVATELTCNDIMVENSFKLSVKAEEQEKKYVSEKSHVGSVPTTGTSRLPSSLLPGTNNLMPSSLSQVDPSVLQQLPEELQSDILESLPAHRRPHVVPNDVSLKYAVDQTGLAEFTQCNEFWVGDAPKWVDNFSRSSSCLLNTIAMLHGESGPGSQLSSIFLRIMSESPLPLDDRQDDAVSCLCELLKQYVKFKIETDIEEIYTCSCLLRRLSSTSKLFQQVYSSILPHLQVDNWLYVIHRLLLVKPMEESLKFVSDSITANQMVQVFMRKIPLLFTGCFWHNAEGSCTIQDEAPARV